MKKQIILPVIFSLFPFIGSAQIQSLTWDTLFGGIRNDCFTAIKKNPTDGSVYFFGYTKSPSITNYNSNGNNFTTDIWVTKTTSSGVLEWSRAYGTKNDEIGVNGVLLPDNTIIVVGNISPGFPIAPMPSNYHDGYDIFLVKISMITGDTIWQKCYGGTGEDIIYDVTTDLNGEIIVVGSTNSTDGDMDTVCYGQKDALIMKFNASGDILAEKKYGGLFSDRLQSVTCLPDGGFAVTGWSLSSDGVFYDNHTVSNNTSDMLVMILDSNLNYLSSRCIGTVFQEEGWSIVEHFGYIYASGITMAAMPSGDINSLKGLSDGFIAKLDLMGNLVWVKTYGGSQNDYGIYLKKSNTALYAFGVTESDDMDIPINEGYEDACFLLIDTTDGLLQDVEMWGTPYNEMFYDILFLDSGFVAVGQHLPVVGQNWEGLIATTEFVDFKLRPNNPVVTSIVNIPTLSSIAIHPNPTSSMVRITMPPETTTNTVTIYNISGQVLFSEQTSEVVYTTDLTQFSQGTYVVEVKNSTGVFRDRVQKL